MTEQQKKIILTALLIGSNFFWGYCLAMTFKSAQWLWNEYALLYKFDEGLVKLVEKHAPELFEDPEFQKIVMDVHFEDLRANFTVKERPHG